MTQKRKRQGLDGWVDLGVFSVTTRFTRSSFYLYVEAYC